MLDLADSKQLQQLLNRHGFSFSKQLGQNFLINPDVCPQMAAYACADADGVIEIGAGVGVLTVQLAQRAKKVLSFELDKRLLPVLAETLDGFDNVELRNADFMQCDLNRVLRETFGGMRVAVCANLPYYITSPILMRLLESRVPLTRIVVMVQQEAADRLCARVGSRAAGAVTVAVDYYARARELFNVPRESFLPSPNVDSAVIELALREKPAVQVADEAFFFRMVKGAFSQRRKTAANGLSAALGLPKETVFSAMDTAGLDRRVRAEALDMEQLAALCGSLFTMM